MNGCFPPAASVGLGIAVVGNAVATSRETCAGDSGALIFRTLSRVGVGVSEGPLRFPIAPRELRAAGTLVAWREESGQQIVVWDRSTRTEVYRADARPIPAGSWAVQADGKLGGSYRDAAGCGVAWASKDEPGWHLLPGPCLDGRVRMAQDRIAYRDGQQIVARTLDGGAAVVARGPGLVGGFDLDATRVAYGLAGCASDTVIVRDLADGEPAPAAHPDVCRAQLLSRTVRIPEGRLVRVRITCPAGCRGRLRLFGTRRPASGSVATRLLIDLPFTRPPGRTFAVSERLTRALVGRLGCVTASEGLVELSLRQATGETLPAPAKRIRLIVDRPVCSHGTR